MLTDLRQGVRPLFKRPWQSLLIILIIAIGVGVGSAVYSVGDDLLLRPLPFDPGDRLVDVMTTVEPSGSLWFNTEQNLDELGKQSKTLDGVAVYLWDFEAITANGETSQAQGMKVDSHFFPVLGVRPALGRAFTAEDNEYGAPGTMILSYSYWQRRFAGDPAVLGKEVLLNKRPYTVIGVMPQLFYFPFFALTEEDYWIPLQQSPSYRTGAGDKFGIARLKTGITLQLAQTEAAQIAHWVGKTHSGQDFIFRLRSYRETIVEGFRPLLSLLAAIILCVQLVVCINVASLLLVEAMRCRKEVEIRFALGGTRWKIARLFLLRALALALAGGLAGAGLAFGLVFLTRSLLPAGFPGASQIALNTTLLWIVILVSLGTGIFFGLWPALAATRKLHMVSLNQASQATQPSTGQSLRKSRKSLVVLQLGFSSAFLLVAGLFGVSMYRLMNVNLGFRLDRRLMVAVNPTNPTLQGDARKQFLSGIQERLLALPGVDAVTVSSDAPLTPRGTREFSIRGAPAPQDPREWTADVETVGANYFEVMGIAMRQGRPFSDEDGEGGSPVAIVNEAFARRFFGNVSPLGKQVCLPDGSGCPWREIVGIAADARESGVDTPAEPTCYLPFWQSPFLTSDTFIAHTRISPSALLVTVQKQMRELAPEASVFGPFTLEGMRSMRLMGSRYRMWFLASIALLALALAAMGVYGVIAGDVEQRRREIGIRMALGATPNNISALFRRQMLFMLVPGLLIGWALAAGLLRFAMTMLYGITSMNPLAYAGTVLIMSAVAALATALPVRRALRESTAEVLRAE